MTWYYMQQHDDKCKILANLEITKSYLDLYVIDYIIVHWKMQV